MRVVCPSTNCRTVCSWPSRCSNSNSRFCITQHVVKHVTSVKRCSCVCSRAKHVSASVPTVRVVVRKARRSNELSQPRILRGESHCRERWHEHERGHGSGSMHGMRSNVACHCFCCTSLVEQRFFTPRPSFLAALCCCVVFLSFPAHFFSCVCGRVCEGCRALCLIYSRAVASLWRGSNHFPARF